MLNQLYEHLIHLCMVPRYMHSWHDMCRGGRGVGVTRRRRRKIAKFYTSKKIYISINVNVMEEIHIPYLSLHYHVS